MLPSTTLMTSHSMSTKKRRKRGARKGKGTSAAAVVIPIPAATSLTTPQDNTLRTLAATSQSLAREISMASKSISTTSTKTSNTSSSLARSKQPFEPVSMYALPTPLLSHPMSLPHPSPPASVVAAPAPAPTPVTKKPSKRKLGFGKNNSDNLHLLHAGSRLWRKSPRR
ncbi:hypothetical protein BDZ97DRAFT_1923017 [Flammula alnicola]|nr:hypothetical protein BDZ97DRAFT_1923017 [Flammula alnicola]